MIRKATIAIALALMAASIAAFAVDRPRIPATPAPIVIEREHLERSVPVVSPDPPRDSTAAVSEALEKWVGSLEILGYRSSDGFDGTARSRAEMSIFSSSSEKADGLLTLQQTDSENATVFQFDLQAVSVGPHLSFVAADRFPEITETYAFAGTVTDGRLEGPVLTVWLQQFESHGIGTGNIALQLDGNGNGGRQASVLGRSQTGAGSNDGSQAGTKIGDFTGEWTGPLKMSTTDWTGEVTQENLNVELSITPLSKGGLSGVLRVASQAGGTVGPREYHLSQVRVSGGELSFVATPESPNVYEAYAFAGAIREGSLNGAVVRLCVLDQGDKTFTSFSSTGSLSLVRR